MANITYFSQALMAPQVTQMFPDKYRGTFIGVSLSLNSVLARSFMLTHGNFFITQRRGSVEHGGGLRSSDDISHQRTVGKRSFYRVKQNVNETEKLLIGV